MTMMRDCPDAELRDLLPDLVHGTLNERDRAAVEAHVARCAECGAELRVLRAAHSALRRGPSVDVGAISRAVARSGRTPGFARAPRRSWAWQRAAVASALVAASVSAILATRGRSRGGSPDPVAVAGQAPQRTGSTAVATAPGSPSRVAPSQGGEAGVGEGLALVAGTQVLDDAELESLLGDLETLEATPSGEPVPLLPALLSDGGV